MPIYHNVKTFIYLHSMADFGTFLNVSNKNSYILHPQVNL